MTNSTAFDGGTCQQTRWACVVQTMRAGFSPRGLSVFFALLLLPVVLIQSYAAFLQAGFFLTHDEAEHLHVLFALTRGERPYVDFIENHPVFFHLVLLRLTKLFGLTETMQVYALGKSLVFAHFAASLMLLVFAFRHFASYLRVQGNAVALIVIALAMSGIWAVSDEWNWGHASLWHLRPDWLCYFYAGVCVLMHFAYHWRLLRGQAASLWMIVIAALCGGVATAILAKSIYFFLPYALLFVTMSLAERPRLRLWWRDYRQPLVVANVLFLALGVFSFVLAVGIELALTHTSIAEYYKANFALNSLKHIVVNAEDFSPLNVLRSLLGLNLLPALVLVLWSLHRFTMAQRTHAIVEYYVWYFLFLVLAVNIALPAFSNGLTWPHYFVPGLLAMLCVLALAIDALFVLLTHAVREVFSPRGAPHLLLLKRQLRWALPLLIVPMLACTVSNRWQAAFDSVESMRFTQQLYGRLVGDDRRDFLPERLLPGDLTYLVFAPQQKPVQAAAWGYFFMLGPDKRLWQDAHTLGLAPDPETYWRVTYAAHPPDVITLAGKEDFLFKKLLLERMQRIKIGWLWQEMQQSYVCLSRKHLNVYVRKALLPRFQSMGWAVCIEGGEDSFGIKGGSLQ